MLVRSVIYGVGFDFMHPFQNENPADYCRQDFRFCLICINKKQS